MLVENTFHIRTSDTDFGKLEVKVINNGDFGTVNTNVYIGVVDPLGNSIKDFPVIPDFNHSTPGDFNVFVDIPKTTDGEDFLVGTYEVTVQIEDDDNPSNTTTEVKTYFFCPSKDVAVNFDVVYDCFAAKIIATDNTDYDDVTFEDRTITLQPPAIPGKPVPTPVTTPNQQLIEDLDFEFATYTATLAGNFTTVTIDDNWTWTTEEEAIDSVSKEVICDLDGCGILSCYADFHDKVHAEANKKGGLMGIREQERDLYIQINGAINLWLLYKSCQDTGRMMEQYDKIKQLLNAAGCKCNEISGPKALQASSGVVYITGPSAYDLWISEGNTGTIDDFLGTLNPATDWEDVDGGHFNSDWQQGGTTLQYRILHRHIEFKGSYVETIGSMANPLPVTDTILEDTFDPANVDTEGKIPIFNAESGCVGYFFLDADGKWKARHVSGFNKTIDTYVQGQLPLVGTLSNEMLFTTEWTDVGDANLEGDFITNASITFQYKVFDKFIAFRGAFENTGTPVVGQAVTKLIDTAFFTGLGIALDADNYCGVADASSNDNLFYGVLRAQSTGLYLYSNAQYDSNNAASIVGVFPITAL